MGLSLAGCLSRPVRLVPELTPGGLSVVGSYVLPPVKAGEPWPQELSGAWLDPATQELFVVSDEDPGGAMMTMRLTVEPAVTLAPVRVVTVEAPVAGRTLDLEGVAPAAGAHLFVSSEGEEVSPGVAVPGILEVTRDGRLVRRHPIPSAWAGMRVNLGLEALSTSPDRQWLFAASEGPFSQDGPLSDFDAGGVSRVLARDLRTGRTREYAYRVEPVPRWSDRPAVGENGISDLLALSADELLILERAYVSEPGPGGRSGNTVRIYRVRLDAAAEVTGRWSLRAEPPAAVLRKTLVLDMASVAPRLVERLQGLENFEALFFGPRLKDGRYTLVLMSDNNGGRNQVTGVVVLAWGPSTGADPSRVLPSAAGVP